MDMLLDLLIMFKLVDSASAFSATHGYGNCWELSSDYKGLVKHFLAHFLKNFVFGLYVIEFCLPEESLISTVNLANSCQGILSHTFHQ
jgi:hypothetical protein